MKMKKTLSDCACSVHGSRSGCLRGNSRLWTIRATTKTLSRAPTIPPAITARPLLLKQATYIIGCPQPLTSTNAQPGECAPNAVKLAAKQFNENGGINGKKVQVLSYDDQGLPEEAVKLATRMVQADGVQAIIGSCISICVLSSGKIYNDAKIPTFGTGTSPTWMAEGWEYVFRACQNNDFALPLVVNKLRARHHQGCNLRWSG